MAVGVLLKNTVLTTVFFFFARLGDAENVSFCYEASFPSIGSMS